MEDIMAAPTAEVTSALRQFLFGIALAGALTSHAQAQQTYPPQGVTVIGEGSVSVPPDYALIASGVTTRAKTVKEATDANSKVMAAVTAALLQAGIEQKDIQTSRFPSSRFIPRKSHAPSPSSPGTASPTRSA
jgi:uncharacterized protein